ncbi:hypothetical protein SCRM01_244 [Synechococcus phage S-CRM01]|uniref:hypothetical protein n=1 Tax=Synechococcus phage S-CRM01 TaxID=1026955 RepID=UPI000209E445|nr:hypothetical protein SCRM01_244 [Synechococcus phage S-CRM01]AEC53190.1 hypothetical protein SCRM01_244 [Synechococcus phage S-CRM01]
MNTSKLDLDLIVYQTEQRFRQAYEQYHQAFMSAHDNIPDAPNILDCIAPSILDYYFRSHEDYFRAVKMRDALTN